MVFAGPKKIKALLLVKQTIKYLIVFLLLSKLQKLKLKKEQKSVDKQMEFPKQDSKELQMKYNKKL